MRFRKEASERVKRWMCHAGDHENDYERIRKNMPLVMRLFWTKINLKPQIRKTSWLKNEGFIMPKLCLCLRLKPCRFIKTQKLYNAAVFSRRFESPATVRP